MKLVICMDLASLASYCALAPITQMLNETGAAAQWLPLMREPAVSKPAGAVASDEKVSLAAYKARRQRARDQWAARELARNCERLGISVAQGARRFDSRALNLGLLFLSESGGNCGVYLQRAFSAAFVDGDNIEDAALVAELVNETGFLDFCQASGEQRLFEVSASLNEQGLVVAPGFVCDGEVFQGRQHLPMIRWIIEGRAGIAPV